jgi:hypothetical protein
MTDTTKWAPGRAWTARAAVILPITIIGAKGDALSAMAVEVLGWIACVSIVVYIAGASGEQIAAMAAAVRGAQR